MTSLHKRYSWEPVVVLIQLRYQLCYSCPAWDSMGWFYPVWIDCWCLLLKEWEEPLRSIKKKTELSIRGHLKKRAGPGSVKTMENSVKPLEGILICLWRLLDVIREGCSTTGPQAISRESLTVCGLVHKVGCIGWCGAWSQHAGVAWGLQDPILAHGIWSSLWVSSTLFFWLRRFSLAFYGQVLADGRER